MRKLPTSAIYAQEESVSINNDHSHGRSPHASGERNVVVDIFLGSSHTGFRYECMYVTDLSG